MVAIGESALAWQCVANIIQNRWNDKRDSWSNVSSIAQIVANKAQFNAYEGTLYYQCMNYLDNRTGSNALYEELIETVMPYYMLEGEDILDGAVLYYSPKSMVPAGATTGWENNSQLEEVFVAGIDSNSFRFYKYK